MVSNLVHIRTSLGARAMGVVALLALVVTLLVVTTKPTLAATTVQLRDVQDRVVGTATMTEQSGGGVLVEVMLSGMLPNQGGDRRLAITSVGLCEKPSFASAGDEAKLLPALQLFNDGGASYKATVADLNLASYMDANGSALVLYADNKADAARIVCGVIASGGAAPAPAATAAAPRPAASATAAPAAPAPAAPTAFAPAPTGGVNEITVQLYDVQERNVGWVKLTRQSGGMTQVEAMLMGLLPNQGGDRRIGVVNVGMCEKPAFTSAGSAVKVFPDIQLYADGTAYYKVMVDGLDLNTLNDADGSAVVVYADKTVESGRIICGMIPAGRATAAPAAPAPAAPTAAPAAPTAAAPAPAAPTAAAPAPAAPSNVVAPTLDSPEVDFNCFSALDGCRFRWSGGSTLAANQYYQLQFFLPGQSIGRGIHVPSKTTSFTTGYNLYDMFRDVCDPNQQCVMEWAVVIVEWDGADPSKLGTILATSAKRRIIL